MKLKEVQAVSVRQARCDFMKKAINIFSIVDLSLLALWLISFIAARITADMSFADKFAATFVIFYAIAAVAVVVHTVASVILLAVKKKGSMPLLITTYVINSVWAAIFAMVIHRFLNAF